MFTLRNSFLLLIFFFCCGFSCNLQNASISEFVHWYGEYAHKNVILDSSIDKNLTIYAKSVKDEDVDHFFKSVITHNGLSCVVDGDFVVVTTGSTGSANALALPVGHGNLTPSPLITQKPADLDSKVLVFHNRLASSMIPVFKEFLSSGVGSVYVSELPGNRLLCRGDKDLISYLVDLAADLDVSPGRYLIEAIVVEHLIESDASAGVSLSLGQSDNFGQILLGSVLNVATGGAAAVLDHADLSAVLRFFQSDGRFNVLSTPSIVVSGAESAKLFVGNNIPVVTGESTSSASSTENPFRTIERKDVGLTLSGVVYPLTDDIVRLETGISASSVSDTTVSGVVDIVTAQRQINTAFDLHLGQVVGVGGLISSEISEQNTKVPFFGDLPLVGAVFRSSVNSESKRNLSVFISVRAI